jgi:hypothetical protein
MREADHRERRMRGLGIGRAARILGVPTVTLRDWMNQGLVPGVRRTEGGHRWIAREDLFAFARKRGLARKGEKRRHPRVQAHKVRLRVKAELSGVSVVRAEGRLRDLSEGGFRADRMRWRTGFAPAYGTRIRFEIAGARGRLSGVSGVARLVWHLDNRRERGSTLGARLVRIEAERQAWFSYVNEEGNG